jgi:hypothetical protein
LIKDRDALTMFEVQRLFDDDNRRDRQCFSTRRQRGEVLCGPAIQLKAIWWTVITCTAVFTVLRAIAGEAGRKAKARNEACGQSFVYLGVMSESDAYGAADYWRYSPHVALLGLYAPVMALAVARWPAWVNLRSAVPTLAMVLVALCVLRMRSDLNNPRGIAWQRFLRAAVADMRPVIPPGSGSFRSAIGKNEH